MKLHELYEDAAYPRRTFADLPSNFRLPIHSGYNLNDKHLTSLEGMPEEVDASVNADRNLFTDLTGAPKIVNGNFKVNEGKLTSLKGAPEHVSRDFDFLGNKVSSFEGGPKYVGQQLWGGANAFTNLHNIHKHVKYIGTGLRMMKNDITSHVLGVLLIEGLQSVSLDNRRVQDILNHHLKNGRDVLACQEALLDAGLDDYAQL